MRCFVASQQQTRACTRRQVASYTHDIHRARRIRRPAPLPTARPSNSKASTTGHEASTDFCRDLAIIHTNRHPGACHRLRYTDLLRFLKSRSCLPLFIMPSSDSESASASGSPPPSGEEQRRRPSTSSDTNANANTTATTTTTTKKRSAVEGEITDANGKVIKRRASRACVSCRLRKVRCDVVDGAPCGNCRWDNVECVVQESRRRK